MDVDVDQMLDAEFIFGVNTGVLDELARLYDAPVAGDIAFQQWLARDAESRSGVPVISAEDLKAARKAVTKRLVGDLDRDDLYFLLLARLRTLEPPPSEADLIDKLKECWERLSDSKLRSNHEEAREERRAWIGVADRSARWLRELGNLDPGSGLPWTVVAMFRVIDDPDLGRVFKGVEPIAAVRRW